VNILQLIWNLGNGKEASVEKRHAVFSLQDACGCSGSRGGDEVAVATFLQEYDSTNDLDENFDDEGDASISFLAAQSDLDSAEPLIDAAEAASVASAAASDVSWETVIEKARSAAATASPKVERRAFFEDECEQEALLQAAASSTSKGPKATKASARSSASSSSGPGAMTYADPIASTSLETIERLVKTWSGKIRDLARACRFAKQHCEKAVREKTLSLVHFSEAFNTEGTGGVAPEVAHDICFVHWDDPRKHIGRKVRLGRDNKIIYNPAYSKIDFSTTEYTLLISDTAVRMKRFQPDKPQIDEMPQSIVLLRDHYIARFCKTAAEDDECGDSDCNCFACGKYASLLEETEACTMQCLLCLRHFHDTCCRRVCADSMAASTAISDASSDLKASAEYLDLRGGFCNWFKTPRAWRVGSHVRNYSDRFSGL
jgi:hypothetical protein